MNKSNKLQKHLTIIGYGMAGQDCLEAVALEKDSIFSVINIVDINAKVLERINSVNFNTAVSVRIYSEISQIEQNLGTVFLALPPYSMKEVLHTLLSQNFDNLVIEKPGPLPMEEELYSKLLLLGKKVYICHQRQYSQHFNWVNEKIQQEAIGKIDSAVVTLGKWDYLTAGTHWMALNHLLFGIPTNIIGNKKLSGKLSPKYGYEVESEAFFTIKHQNDITVHWRISTDYNERSDLRILGNNGYINVKYQDILAQYHSPVNSELFTNYGNPRYTILAEASLNKPPVIGCRLSDLQLYLALFFSLDNKLPSV